MEERFQVGRVFARSLSLWARNLPMLFALVLVVNLPRFAFAIYRIYFPSTW